MRVVAIGTGIEAEAERCTAGAEVAHCIVGVVVECCTLVVSCRLMPAEKRMSFAVEGRMAARMLALIVEKHSSVSVVAAVVDTARLDQG